MSTMAEIRAMREAYEEKIKNEGQAALKAEFAGFFEKNPKVEAIRWTQYTPHFNDGDPCTFSLHEFRYKVAGLADDGGDDGDGFYDTYGDELKGLKTAIRAFEK